MRYIDIEGFVTDDPTETAEYDAWADAQHELDEDALQDPPEWDPQSGRWA